MDEQELFAKRLVKIYDEIAPTLLALAHRYKAPNPNVVVDGWRSRAYEIVNRFDNGDLVAKVYATDEPSSELEDYDPKIHDQEKFVETLKGYLKVCFTRDILKVYNREKKDTKDPEGIVAATTSSYSKTGFSDSISSLLKYDAITLVTITRLVRKDAERAAKNKTCVLDAVQELFLRALLNLCEGMCSRGKEWENLIVVPDLEETDNKKFFSYDFRSELEVGVRRELNKMIIKENNPIILAKLSVLAKADNKSALQKRLFRYLYEYRNGIPSRLRTRIKHRDL